MNEFEVVKNHEEQYSIWPCGRDLNAGWELADYKGSRQERLDYVAQVWST